MHTILDLLTRLEDQLDRQVFIHDRRGRRQEGRTWAETVSRSRSIGARLLGSGLAPGDYVFLQLPNSHALIECFFGAISVGLLPCCLAPPRAHGGLDTFQERMGSLLGQFPNSLLVAQVEVGEASGVPFVAPPEPVQGESLPSPASLDPETTAFIQLTSGSTRAPKAVCISHRALISNVRNAGAACKGTHEDALVTWLPFYHDMGLVGSLFGAIDLLTDLHVLQPETFVARPRIWLQTISKLPNPVISNAPNFAYENCVRRIPGDEVGELDLSRWRVAGCGAERVRQETMHSFANHFAAAGFRPEAYVPCYGMAETTLAVTYGYGGRRPAIDDGNVSCGAPIPETEIIIRGPGGEPLPDGQQGEISVRSPSLCSGYVGAEHPSPVRDGWLYTGDRGYLREGELYITGRYKDLIIVDGVNIDPDEIEAIAEARADLAGGRSAAFALDVDGRERAVLVIEADAKDAATFAAWNREIGDGVARNFGFKLYDMLFVRRGGINKTSSGKVQRAKLQDRYRQENLESLWQQRQQSVEEPPDAEP